MAPKIPKLTWKEHVEARSKNLPGYPVVEAIWIDAQSQATVSWESELTYEPQTVTTVGYLVHEDDLTFTVLSMINRAQVGHGITIPKLCLIGKLRYL